MSMGSRTDVPTNVDVLAKQCVESGTAGHVQALLAEAEAAGIVFSERSTASKS